MYILAVTGGIACGKTVVSHEIGQYGAAIISADQIAYSLSEPGRPIYEAYVEHFGEHILDEGGKLDRRSIACIVFNDSAEKDWVDRTTHPLILNCIRDRLVENQERGVPITVLDIPLLFEVGWEYMADEIWVVWLNSKRQFRRLMYRNRISYLEAFARINAQMDLGEKKKLADATLNNAKTKYELKKKVERLMKVKFPHLKRPIPIEEEYADYLTSVAEKKAAALEVKRAAAAWEATRAAAWGEQVDTDE